MIPSPSPSPLSPRCPFPVSGFLLPFSCFLFLSLPSCSSPLPRTAGLSVSRDHSTGVLSYAVAFTPDDRALAAVELAESFTLVLRDTSTSRERLRVPLGPPDWDITGLSIDATTAWVSSRDGTVRGLDLATGRPVHRWPLGAAATAVAAAGDHILTGTDTGVLCLRRRRDGALLQCAAAHAAAITAIDARAGRAVSAAADGTAILWQLPALRILARRAATAALADARLAPDGRRVALAERDDIVLWTPGGAEQRCRGHQDAVNAVAWSAGGRLLSAARDRSVRVWTTTGGRCAALGRLGGFAHQVRDITVGGGGRLAATAAWAPDLRGRSTSVLHLSGGGR